MFGQNPNAMNNGPQCNTYMRPMTSEQSMLTPGLWNQNLSIKIRPAIGRDANGAMQYDKNRQGQTALSPENCHALTEKFDAILRPAYEAALKENLPCDAQSISVVSGAASKNVTTITMRPSNDPEDPTPVMGIELSLNVDANGVAAEGNVYRHEFGKKTVYIGYSPATGPKGKSSANSDFDAFMNIVRAVGGSRNAEILVENHMAKYESMRSSNNTNGSGGGSSDFNAGAFSGMTSPGGMAGGGFGLSTGGELPFN